MKGAVLATDSAGKGHFRLDANLPIPVAGPDDIVIKLGAASLNPIETLMRDGYGDSLFKLLRDKRVPRIMGLDGAGIVESVGRNVRSWKPGDAVMATNWPYKAGFYAEYVKVPEGLAAPVPGGLSIQEAAALPYTAMTVSSVLEATGLGPETSGGKKVLVHGGSGGLGSILVQLLHHWGAWVATTCGTANVDKVTALGADRVIDYRAEDFTQILTDMDVVVNTVAPDPAAKELKEAPHFSVLRRGGVYASVISPTLTLADMMLGPPGLLASGIWMLSARAYWLTHGKHHRWVYYKPSRSRMQALHDWAAAGTIKPVIGDTFPLDRIEAAFERLADGRAGGKLLLVLNPEIAGAQA